MAFLSINWFNKFLHVFVHSFCTNGLTHNICVDVGMCIMGILLIYSSTKMPIHKLVIRNAQYDHKAYEKVPKLKNWWISTHNNSEKQM